MYSTNSIFNIIIFILSKFYILITQCRRLIYKQAMQKHISIAGASELKKAYIPEIQT